MVKNSDNITQSGGIQSLDAALRLLDVLANEPGPASLSDLARACDMPPSKVHRYLASFQNAGLVSQANRSGKYDLGPGAISLGLSAIARHDFVNRAADGMADLCAQTGLTVLLSVWGNAGATVIRWERAASPVFTSMGLGSTLPLLNSATGRAFLTWAPTPAVAKTRDAELRHAKRNPNLIADITPTQRGLETLTDAIRARGFASVDGRFIPGLVAAAAPVLDWQGQAQTVITLIGTDQAAIAADSAPVQQLITYCAGLSFST